MKKCCKCAQEKEDSEFYRNSFSRDGRQSHCKSCSRKMNEERLQNPGRNHYHKSLHSQGLIKCSRCQSILPFAYFPIDRARPLGHKNHCKPCEAVKAKASRERPGAPNYQERWRERNPGASKAYYLANKEGSQHRSRARRARKREARIGNVEDIRCWESIIRLDPCGYCGEKFENIDHIVPIRSGGSHSYENLTSSCEKCNKEKATKPLLAFLLWRSQV